MAQLTRLHLVVGISDQALVTLYCLTTRRVWGEFSFVGMESLHSEPATLYMATRTSRDVGTLVHIMKTVKAAEKIRVVKLADRALISIV